MLTFFSPSDNYSVLDWQARPDALKEKIQYAWSEVSKMTRWTQNGKTSYRMACISELKLLKKIITDSYPERKEFYFLDVGAGQFQLISNIVLALNRDLTLPQDIKVHLIGLRGEKNPEGLELERRETGICIQYNFWGFKIENLLDEFRQHDLNFLEKIDIIVSQWTFRHLVDPLGTYLQTYNLLRKNGFLIMDGFFFLMDDISIPNRESPHEICQKFFDRILFQLHQLACQGNNSFLVYPTIENSVLHQFVIKKSNLEPLLLNLNYVGEGFVSYEDSTTYNSSQAMTTFRRTSPTTPVQLPEHYWSLFETYSFETQSFYGRKELFDELMPIMYTGEEMGRSVKFEGELPIIESNSYDYHI